MSTVLNSLETAWISLSKTALCKGYSSVSAIFINRFQFLRKTYTHITYSDISLQTWNRLRFFGFIQNDVHITQTRDNQEIKFKRPISINSLPSTQKQISNRGSSKNHTFHSVSILVVLKHQVPIRWNYCVKEENKRSVALLAEYLPNLKSTIYGGDSEIFFSSILFSKIQFFLGNIEQNKLVTNLFFIEQNLYLTIPRMSSSKETRSIMCLSLWQ